VTLAYFYDHNGIIVGTADDPPEGDACRSIQWRGRYFVRRPAESGVAPVYEETVGLILNDDAMRTWVK
jgi:hypothetical protein